MGEWREGYFSEIADIIMGQSPKGEFCNSIGSGVPLLNGPTEFGIKFPTPIQYTTEVKKASNINDILFCVRGSTTGRMNWSNIEYAIGRGLASIRHKKGEAYRYFLKGILDFNLPNLLSSATGSTFPNVSRSQLEELKILIPPLKEQKAIAQVLSSLDDKIDLLHRQNKTLEEMAQTLFRQWFIEEAKDEWEDVELGSVIETTSGSTPSRKNMAYYDDGKYAWVKSKELNGSFLIDTEEKITEEALQQSSAKLLPENSILIAMYGATVGKYTIISKQMTCNQAICALKPNENYPYTFLYMYVKNYKDEIINMAVGSAQQNISQLLIKQLPICSDIKLISKFHTEVEPLFQKIKSNIKQVKTLENMRDTLLPKLMSGEVRVKL